MTRKVKTTKNERAVTATPDGAKRSLRSNATEGLLPERASAKSGAGGCQAAQRKNSLTPEAMLKTFQEKSGVSAIGIAAKILCDEGAKIEAESPGRRHCPKKQLSLNFRRKQPELVYSYRLQH